MFERAIGVPGQAQDLRGRRVVLVPTVGAWRETSTDLDLLVELIAHALADEETSTIQVAHHQSVARQKFKLVADSEGRRFSFLIVFSGFLIVFFCFLIVFFCFLIVFL